MQLVDSNIIIYAAKPDGSVFRQLLTDEVCMASAVSKVEVLGYQGLKDTETPLGRALRNDACSAYHRFRGGQGHRTETGKANVAW
jgi:hypothetical protein